MIVSHFYAGPDRGPGEDEDEGEGYARTLLVMLPGAGIEAEAFAGQGMIAALHEREPRVDVITAQPSLDLYLDGEVASTLHRAVVEPALAGGCSRVFLLGISLGGMGAMQYAAAHENRVDGMFLLAPFLGTQGTIAEIATAGGFSSWPPPDSVATAGERRMLAWLRDHLAHKPSRPVLYLGYGQTDRFAHGHRMLAERLPDTSVVTDRGGHDWDTWLALWRRLLDLSPFSTATPPNWTLTQPGGYHGPRSEE